MVTPSCRYDSDDYSKFHIDEKTGDDWRKVYSTPEKHPCYDPSKVCDAKRRSGKLRSASRAKTGSPMRCGHPLAASPSLTLG